MISFQYGSSSWTYKGLFVEGFHDTSSSFGDCLCLIWVEHSLFGALILIVDSLSHEKAMAEYPWFEVYLVGGDSLEWDLYKLHIRFSNYKASLYTFSREIDIGIFILVLIWGGFFQLCLSRNAASSSDPSKSVKLISRWCCLKEPVSLSSPLCRIDVASKLHSRGLCMCMAPVKLV